MARIRTVKPELFLHEELYGLEAKTNLPIRIAWIGLFTVADREGRFKWQPNILKLHILPWDQVDFSKVLEALRLAGFIKQYAVDGKVYGFIPNFTIHQKVRSDEAESQIPVPSLETESATNPDLHRDEPASSEAPINVVERKGKERKGREEQIPAEPSSAASNSPLLEDEITKPWLDKVNRDVQEAWIKTYDDPQWIAFEIKKADIWCKAKPKRAPKSDFQSFLTRWLARGWESYRKKIPDSSSRNVTPLRMEDIA